MSARIFVRRAFIHFAAGLHRTIIPLHFVAHYASLPDCAHCRTYAGVCRFCRRNGNGDSKDGHWDYTAASARRTTRPPPTFEPRTCSATLSTTSHLIIARPTPRARHTQRTTLNGRRKYRAKIRHNATKGGGNAAGQQCNTSPFCQGADSLLYQCWILQR